MRRRASISPRRSSSGMTKAPPPRAHRRLRRRLLRLPREVRRRRRHQDRLLLRRQPPQNHRPRSSSNLGAGPRRALKAELASSRPLRERNKAGYRIAHWPIWIFVFFIAPGPSPFELFERGFDRRKLVWLGAVILATGIAAVRGRLPGAA